MTYRNFTAHSVDVYPASAFENLEQKNPTTWFADGVTGEAIATFPSEGEMRIATETESKGVVNDIPTYSTKYGALTNEPESVEGDDILIVSLPTKSMAVAAMHPLAQHMVSPYQVVRDRANPSLVLGCTGVTY